MPQVRDQSINQGGPGVTKPPLDGAVPRREAGSEGYAEKYRVVVDEGYLKDEPVGQRWGKVEPALWGEGVLYTHRTKVFADGTVRRSGRDPRRTSRVLGWHRGKRRHKRKRNEKQCSGSSRTAG